MKSAIAILILVSVSLSKPIYDLKKSYVINLTPINYADQVTKYRQNTNYVSVVQFYKAAGISYSILRRWQVCCLCARNGQVDQGVQRSL